MVHILSVTPRRGTSQEGDLGKLGLRVLWGSKDKMSSHSRKEKAGLVSREGAENRAGGTQRMSLLIWCVSPQPAFMQVLSEWSHQIPAQL